MRSSLTLRLVAKAPGEVSCLPLSGLYLEHTQDLAVLLKREWHHSIRIVLLRESLDYLRFDWEWGGAAVH
jgi:hypothetical protein